MRSFTTTDDSPVPLGVDLDGTLIEGNLLWTGFRKILLGQPHMIPRLVVALFRGRAAFKQCVARTRALSCADFKTRDDVVDFIRAQRKKNRPIVLSTASDFSYAMLVFKCTGLFDHVIASDGRTNMKGAAKAGALAHFFKNAPFDYIGNDPDDFAVWKVCRKALVVSSNRAFVENVRKIADVEKIFAVKPDKIIKPRC